jgi:hypothetical protein
VIALRSAQKSKNRTMAKQASKAKASCNSQYKKTEKDKTSEKREEGWDSYLQGDKCMYQLSSTECAKRVAIRKQCVLFLKQLAKERDSSEDQSFKENATKLEKTPHMLSLQLKTQNFSARSQEKKCKKLDTFTETKNGNCSRKNLMESSKVFRSLPKATTSRSSRFSKDDQTIRSLVTAAIDDDESVIAARHALESARRQLKLNKQTSTATSSEVYHVPRENQVKGLKSSNKKPSLVTNSVTSSSLISCDDEETIRSSVIASIDDNESVIAARNALEAIRTHFKLGAVSTTNADISTSYCKPHSINNTSKEVVWPRSNEDISIVSDVTKSFYEDNSVMAARAALEQARSQLEIFGLLSSSSCRDLSVGGSSVAAFGETNAPEASLEYCSRKGPDLPDVVAFDSLSLHPSTCKPQCGARKDLSEVQHYCDQSDMDIHSLRSGNLCSDRNSPLFDQLSSSAVADKTLSIKPEIRNLHSFSHRIISSDTNNHDGESVTRFFDNSYEKQPIAEASPSAPFMEIGDADFDNDIWNQSDSWDGRGTLLLDGDGTWCHSAHTPPLPCCPSYSATKIERHFSSPCIEVDGREENLSLNQTDQPYPPNTSSTSGGNNPMNCKCETPMISILNGSRDDWIASPSQCTLLCATPSPFLIENSETTPTITICDGSTEDWTMLNLSLSSSI